MDVNTHSRRRKRDSALRLGLVAVAHVEMRGSPSPGLMVHSLCDNEGSPFARRATIPNQWLIVHGDWRPENYANGVALRSGRWSHL